MKRKIEIRGIVPWIWMVFGIGLDGWYHFVYGKEMLDSDMASEMILADILNKEHSLTGLTESWIYSTVIKVLSIQWPFRLGLALFPNNWHMARSVSTLLVICFYAFVTWLVFHVIERDDIAPWGSAFVVFPGGTWYFFHVIFGAYYFSLILISLFSFALIIIIYKTHRAILSNILTVVVIIIGVLSGMAGIKQLMFFYAPLCIASTVLYFKEVIGKKQINNAKLSLLITAVVASASSFIGYLINICILQKIYKFDYYGNQMIEFNEGFLDYLRYFIWSYGYTDEKVMMSPIGIVSMLGVVFGGLILLSVILMVLKFNHLTDLEQITVAVASACIFFVCFIFAYVDGAMQWLLPILPFGYILLVLEIGTERVAFERSRFVCFNVAILILLIVSCGTIYNEFAGPMHLYRAQRGLGPVVEMLRDEGYTQGISKFWTSNIITELSDGEIEMWTLGTENDQWPEWLTRSDHIGGYPEGRYFYLFETPISDGFEGEKKDLDEQFRDEHPELRLIYDDGKYAVYSN